MRSQQKWKTKAEWGKEWRCSVRRQQVAPTWICPTSWRSCLQLLWFWLLDGQHLFFFFFNYIPSCACLSGPGSRPSPMECQQPCQLSCMQEYQECGTRDKSLWMNARTHLLPWLHSVMKKKKEGEGPRRNSGKVWGNNTRFQDVIEGRTTRTWSLRRNRA